MRRTRILHALVLAGAAAASLAGCQVGATETPSFCDGIDGAMGGCAPDRPTFSGTTCAAVGIEFGKQVNDRLLPIFSGPDSVNQESRAVRATQVASVAISLANLHLRRIGIIATCGVDEFMTAAETQFSDEFKAQAGSYRDDGPPVSYEKYLAALRGLVSIIDAEESAPLPSP